MQKCKHYPWHFWLFDFISLGILHTVDWSLADQTSLIGLQVDQLRAKWFLIFVSLFAMSDYICKKKTCYHMPSSFMDVQLSALCFNKLFITLKVFCVFVNSWITTECYENHKASLDSTFLAFFTLSMCVSKQSINQKCPSIFCFQEISTTTQMSHKFILKVKAQTWSVHLIFYELLFANGNITILTNISCILASAHRHSIQPSLTITCIASFLVKHSITFLVKWGKYENQREK